MGESKLKLAKREEMLLSCAGVQTMAGRVQVRWETESAATPMGQLAYFIEFLNLTGLWSRWLESCPLAYTSPNAPSKAEVLGTWMLSMLAGPPTLFARHGDPLRRGQSRPARHEEGDLRRRAAQCPETHPGSGRRGVAGYPLADSVAPLLEAAWILDIDTTIKPLYGKQEGALVGYNPKKPGRPSHSLPHLPDGRAAPGDGG